MDAAKNAVKKFTSKSGHHDTTVHEQISPAVQHETVEQRQHENMTTALDREVHQDHYHTSEQPIAHSETLQEQHHHNAMPVEHRNFEHDNSDDVKRRLAEEQSKYRDESTRVEGEHTQSAMPTVAGEHTHHQVYENIQPVVNKQTIEPHVVHTTVPIHETHHNAAQHHSASQLPPVSMDEFKKHGGALGGREERHDQFEGEPKWSQVHQGEPDAARHSGVDGQGNIPRGSAMGSTNTDTTSKSKPSFMSKLDPRKDADGDGKKGFME